MVRILVGTGVAFVLSVAGIAWYVAQRGSHDIEISPIPPILHPADSSRFTGTASCSARACHGNLEPIANIDGTQRNEHTIWLTQDRHANAYRVLIDDKRSQEMVARLGYKSAHQEKRCLICHTNPDLISDLSNVEIPAGVGCETCHGAAKDWLVSHTGWFSLDEGEKKKRFQEHGMTWLRGPEERAKQCVHCHVGTGGNADVNHDLIAAGHPRLEFELTAFLANMPEHWIERNKEPGREGVAWITGQVVTARAGLQLLQTRAADPAKPWPEFAEYDCFACHHDLRESKWRREPRRHEEQRKPGTPRWNDRYLTLFPGLVGLPQALTKPWWQLIEEMEKPRPSQSFVGGQAGELIKLLDLWLTKKHDGDQISELIIDYATGATRPSRSNWDAAAQVYLALAALRPNANEAQSKALKEFGDLLAFPPGTNSPETYRENEDFDKQLDKALARIRKAFLPQR